MSPSEYRALGKAIEAADHEGHGKPPLLAVLVLALTGCRRNEVFSLTPSVIDLHNQCFRFEDTKTGQQTRPIGKAACEALKDALELGGGTYVFPGASGNTHLINVKFFGRLCDKAGLKNVTISTLRHAFATVALELGYSEPIVGGLLGHRRHSVTSGYTHLVDRALVEVADHVSSVIASRLERREGGSDAVVPLRRA